MIVLMHFVGGISHREIADHFDLSKSHVSNICRDPRAQQVIDEARTATREKLLGDIEARLDAAAHGAVRVIERTLDADISPVHKAKPNQDRVAIKVLEGRGHLNRDGNKESAGFQISGDQFERLMTGLKSGTRIQNIDPFEEPEIEDADFEVIENGKAENGTD